MQLTRPVQRLTEKELPGSTIERHTGAQLEPVVFGSVLQSKGWMRGQVGDGGSILEHAKYFPSAQITAVLSHSPLIVGYFDIGEKTRPEKLFFVRGYSRGDWGVADDSRAVPLRLIDEVVVSEVLGLRLSGFEREEVMLPPDLLSLVSQPVSPYMQHPACGIVWLDPGRLTPIEAGGERLTKEQMLSLASTLFGAPVQTNTALAVVKNSINADALDLFASEVIEQASTRSRQNSQGHRIGIPAFLFDITALIGARQTAQAIRKSVLAGDYTLVPALQALLAIEKAHAIGFCVGFAKKGAGYWTSAVDTAIGEMCAQCGVSEEERELRSLPVDPAKKKAAEKALETLFSGGYPWDERTFHGTVLDHPLLIEAAKRLVWGELAEDGSARNLFRIIESKTLAKIGGESAKPRFPVVIVHPAQLDQSEIEPWSALWTRQKLTSPFAQWNRKHVRPREAAFPEEPISPSALLVSLESRGWKRGPIDRGILNRHSKDFPHLKNTAHVRYSGIPVSFGGEWRPQRLEAVEFRSGEAPLPIERVSPVAISTVYSDLHFLTREV